MEASSKGPLLILDIDLENRPLSYLGEGWTSAEITAFAWAWSVDKLVHTLLLTRDGYYMRDDGVLLPQEIAFASVYVALCTADIVTGHYLRKHDLPLFNGQLVEAGMQCLPSLRVQDTHQDFVRRKDISASQENLASMFGLAEPKHHMTMSEWRRANRLSPEGIEAARERVSKDVVQHMALRQYMVDHRLLRAPRFWHS